MLPEGQTSSRSTELAALAAALHPELELANAAREVSLAACRRTIQACSASIRAVHRGESEGASALADDAAASLRDAQAALAPHPALAAAGPLHDAEKEYAEARLTAALVGGQPLPSHRTLGVELGSWLGGLAEAASELRRNLLDRLREGAFEPAETLFAAMDDVYGLLTSIDYPDAITGGARRHADALRAVLERTRGDLTTTTLQRRLQQSIDRQLPPDDGGPAVTSP